MDIQPDNGLSENVDYYVNNFILLIALTGLNPNIPNNSISKPHLCRI